MPTAAITVTDRYIFPEVGKIYWLPAVANVNAVTRVEMNAGSDLTAEVADATGWEVSADRVAVPDAGSKFTARISGRVNPGDAQLTFWADQQTTDIRDLLSRGDQGYVLMLYGGDVAGQKMDVFPVEVSAVSKPVQIGGEAARIMVDFSIRRVPGEDVAIPA